MRPLEGTYERKSDAEKALSLTEAQMTTGEWIDPARAKVALKEYAEVWIEQRPGLRPRTKDLYRWLLRKYIEPGLGGVPVGKLDTPTIRQWRADLLDSGKSASVTAKAYRLLRAVLMTAADDDRIIPRNPCRLRGAGDERPEERPVLTVAQVFQLADAMKDRRFRGLVLIATFASLRWGEATALRRKDVDLRKGTVRVRAAYAERSNGELVLGPPKSRAGLRTVSIPAVIITDLRAHLDEYAEEGPDALVFPGRKGGPLRRGNFNRAAGWKDAVAKIGVSGLHFHDLRHSGNMLAAATGTGLRDLMTRMGQDSVRAAMIYLHATSGADRTIADAMNAQVEAERDSAEDDRDEDDEGGTGAAVPAV
jgi:integrase